MGKPLRVLLVEDRTEDAELLLRHLRRSGYDPYHRLVDTAAGIREALREQEWDVVLSDHCMPHCSAQVALAVLQESGLDLPFIIVSGAIGEETAVALMRAGAHDYVMKGRLERLVPVIEREMQEARYRRERHQTQQALAEMSAKLQAIFQASPLPIVGLDAAGRVTAWSPAAERFFGWSEAEVLGRVPPTIPPERLAEHLAALRRLAPDESLLGVVVRCRRRDGSQVDLSLSAAPLSDAAGRVTGQVQVYVDVTARNRFLEAAAHELRSPMTTIRLLANRLLKRMEEARIGERMAPLAEMLEIEVDRLANLLTEILEAFRAQEGQLPFKREPVNLAELIRLVLGPFRFTAEGHRFRTEGLGADVWVQGDVHRLEQVLHNLVSNAVKFSPPGSAVAVKLQVREQRALISVRDEGVGIPADQLPRVFEAFFRADNLRGRDPGGLGLGLFIAQGVIQRHAGRIWAESEPGKGTTFYVELPTCAAEEVS